MGWSGKHTLAAAAVAGVAALYLWGPGAYEGRALPPDAASPAGNAAIAAAADASGTASAASRVPAGTDPFLAPGLRYRLEEMIQEALAGGTPSDPEGLKARMAALTGKYFPPEMAERARALGARYVDYRVALGKITPPADPGDPLALRAAMEARQKLQRQHFTGEEYDALFAKEAELDRYTVARVEIERNPALTAVQKETALRAAERELGDKERSERAAATQHLEAAAQTAALNAKGATEAEKFAEREAAYGRHAARELERMEREDREWQARLADYERAREKLSPDQLQQYRESRFTYQEQMRLEAALALRGASPR